MIQFTRFALLLGMAGGLTAQTLSFGEITLVTPATTPPTYVVNIVLSTANTQYATAPNQPVGFQFDLNYDPTSLNVTIGLGASSVAAGAQITPPTQLGTLQNNPFCAGALATPPTACVQPQDTLAGQRAIIIGCCSNAQINNPVNGPNPPTSNVIADGVVATLTVQATSTTPASQTLTLPSTYMVGTTSGVVGTTNNGAQAIPLTVGAGSSDPGATGILDLSKVYLAGGVYPGTSDTAPNFGSGAIALNDVLNILFSFDNLSIPGFTTPACGSDRFDAMDTFPQDTATTRGGARNGTLGLNDVLTDLFTFDKLTGYTSVPVRISEPYTCSASLQSQVRGPGGKMVPRTPPEVVATLVFGANEGAGTGQDRIPVYLESRRDLSRLALTFGAGDQQSKWQFQTAAVGAPSVLEDSTAGITGALAVAWLQGLDARAGRRLLLGYVVGPSGSGANLRVLGMGASLIDGLQEVGLEVSGVGVAQQ